LELKRFVDWMSKLFGYSVIIIGGWAKFLHVGGRGSRDIDVVLPDLAVDKGIAETFFRDSGYLSEGFLVKNFFKVVETANGPEKVYFDVFVMRDGNFVEGTNIELPWSLIETHSVRKDLEGTEVRVPTIELLTMYKVKAFHDRSVRMARGEDTIKLRAKLPKDQEDILELISAKDFDVIGLIKLAKECDFLEVLTGNLKRIALDGTIGSEQKGRLMSLLSKVPPKKKKGPRKKR